MNNEIKFYIPFEGFYNSIYDNMINNIIEDEINEGYLTEDQAWNLDFKPIHLEMSKDIFDNIIETFIDELDLNIDSDSIKFDGLYSPKFYNYSTDKIIAICDNKTYDAITKHIESNFESCLDYIEEASQSRSGFHSFYEGLAKVKQTPYIYLEYIFQWFTLDEYREEVIYNTTDNLHEIIFNNIAI